MNSRIQIFLLGLLIIVSQLITPNSELYSQDDYVEVKGDAKVDTLTFSTFGTDTTWTFPSTPLTGEVFYNYATSRKRPYYYDGTGWKEFGGTDRYAASLIVAASDSLDKSRADRVCSGSNDQTVINQAISDMSATGGAVYLLEGIYRIGASINMASNIALIGAGKGTLLRGANAIPGLDAIYATGVNHILISRLAIDFPGAGEFSSGIHFNAVTNSKIEGVILGSGYICGINFTGSSNNIISGNIFQWLTYGPGISLNSSSNNIVIGNKSQGSNSGINVSTASSNTILSNDIAVGGYGVAVFQSVNNTISGNNVSSTANYGIIMYGSSANNIFGNNIHDCSGNGIYLTISNGNSYRNNIVGNVIQRCSLGIYLQSFNDYNSVTNNIISDNGGAGGGGGILVDSNNNFVSSNLFYDSAGTGRPITIGSTRTGNYLTGNLITTWPAGYNTINDASPTGTTGTKYFDKAKITLEPGVYNQTIPTTIIPTGPTSHLQFNSINPWTPDNGIADGKSPGDILILENINTGPVTLNDNANMQLGSASRVLGQNDTLTLIWDGTDWIETGYADN